ncbi:energy transducer TonB [Psychroserpens burtonensis]|uniref:Energy transducer TonB n=1 Tax=Psychroserpens burtonensis TaxID=49278 RepID=A0A5C7B4E0_9FLAO|nr:energy transducer TonB [Psychroserpens burtonensis]TXE15304.1 energy transducer TonB [Psychroserpens burtonensis]
MKYLETKHEQNSAKITALIAVILVLLLFVMGNTYMDPPEEYGVAINFGNSEVGSGKVQPTEPIKSRVSKEVVKEDKQAEKVEEVKTASEASSKAEDVMTNESAEAIAIKKAKEAKANADAKAKADADRKEKLRQEAEAKKAKEEQDKKDKLDALIGGVKNSDGPTKDGEGPGDGPGDKGELDGSLYAPYNGIPGSGNGGVGYGLKGRGKPSFKMQDGCENEYGKIMVDIVVDPSGRVIEATSGVQGSDNVTACLKEQAKKIAMSYKWEANSNAPARQFGKVIVNFSPTN